MDNSLSQINSMPQGVYTRKNRLLKERLRVLIFNKGMSESAFYHSVGLEKQYWYLISWGLQEPTMNVKLMISKALNSDSSLIWQVEKNGN